MVKASSAAPTKRRRNGSTTTTINPRSIRGPAPPANLVTFGSPRSHQTARSACSLSCNLISSPASFCYPRSRGPVAVRGGLSEIVAFSVRHSDACAVPIEAPQCSPQIIRLSHKMSYRLERAHLLPSFGSGKAPVCVCSAYPCPLTAEIVMSRPDHSCCPLVLEGRQLRHPYGGLLHKYKDQEVRGRWPCNTIAPLACTGTSTGVSFFMSALDANSSVNTD